MTWRRFVAIVYVAVAVALPGGVARAAEPRELGVWTDWAAYLYSDKSGKTCYIASEPTKDEGDYSRRGRIIALVTHQPAAKSFNVVSFVAGYTHKKDSEASVVIGEQKFALFTQDDTSWAYDSKTDNELVAAMQAGNEMVVDGVSSRDTKTRDTYSLRGFTSAHKAASKACNVK